MTTTLDQIASQSRIVAAPTSLKPGLYFGLEEDAYHGDSALGSGSVRALAKCPIYYWTESWMNPFRAKDEDTAALLFGRALHKLVLEGGAAFERGFAREPSAADFPDALRTADDIKAVLKDLGGKVSGTKAELISRLKATHPTAVILDELLATFQVDCERTRRTPLKRAIYDQVVAAAAFIAGDERVRAAFQGGRSEVSVVWEHAGVMLKARFDHMRLGKNAKGDRIGLITDLKSFANIMEAPPERAVIQAIANTRLDIQAASYLKAAAKVGEYIKAGHVFGAEGVSTEWLDAFTALEPTDWQFFWVFYQKNAPVSLLRMTEPQSPMIEAANMEFARAIESYKENMQAFGTNWKFVDPMPDPRIDASDLPKWLIGA